MKKQIINYIPIILIGVLAVFGCQKSIEQYYHEGSNQFNSGDFKGAIESYSKYIEKGNNEKLKNAAIEYRALSYFALKEVDIALKELNGLIDKLPKSDVDLWNYYYCRSYILSDIKKYPEAIADINIALEYNMPKQFREMSIGYRALYKYKSGDFIGAKVDSFILKKNYNGYQKNFNDFIKTLQSEN